MDRTAATLVLLAAVAAAGCGPGVRQGPGLDATLWVRTSAEYEALARQTYRAARRQMRAALRDSSWSAAREQEPPYREKPPAVILDVDETVLDNSPFQARLIRQRRSFGPDIWARWVREARAEPVPGALDFARFADREGVTVVYLTNRDHELEPATRENLERAGFPLSEDRDLLLTEGERESWTSGKAARRRWVARDYRVLLIVGDNLNDFTRGAEATPRERRQLAREFASWWGEKWFVLPNPMYGSWQESLYEFQRGLSPAERRSRELEHLDPRRGADAGADTAAAEGPGPSRRPGLPPR